MKKTIEIVDTEDKLTVRVNGVLMYNYHGTYLKALRSAYSRNDLISMIFRQNAIDTNTLFDMFIEQLRSEGYFDENR